MTRSSMRRRGRLALLVSCLALAVPALAACGNDDAAGGDAGDETLNVTVITKDPDNQFWTSMVEGANAAAKDQNVEVTVAAGRDQTDADSQVQAIENAISRGDDAILIANNGPAVNDAIQRAKDAGLYVLALDTPTTPIDLVNATFATDNRAAGKLIGQWAAGQLGGKPATIAMLNLFGDKIVSVDYERGQGFLAGMGVDVKDENKNGDEAATGAYTGGTYTIACNEATNGAEDGGRSAMENCLSANPGINVVYTANETSGTGAVQALKAAGNNAIVVSLDGSCAGVKSVADGSFGAVAQQYPSEMGKRGIEAVIANKRNGVQATPSAGLQFIDTGTKLVTDKAVTGLDSIDTTEGTTLCW